MRKTTTTKPTKTTKAKAKPKPAAVRHIAPDLRPLAVAIEGLVLDPDNARGHNSDNLSAITASLKKYGQRKPIVVNRRNKQVEAGNGLVEAAAALGWSHVAVVWVDDDPAAQRGFSLADNRTAELAEWKDDVLEALCREWQTDGADLDLYDALKLDALLGVPEAEGGGEGEEQLLTDRWEVVIEARDEKHQQQLFTRFEKEGLKCRLLTL